MKPFTDVTSKIIPLPHENVDTDQIIPARFLKVTDKAGLGDNLICDWRYNEDGTPKADFILNQQAMQGREILLAGDNFGCGSSREHAPWALLGWGFRTVISTSFADIFRNNSLKNGFLPVEVDKMTHKKLFEQLEENPEAEVTIDLQTQSLTLPDGSAASFPIDGFNKTCMLDGIDQLGYLMKQTSHIEAFESHNPGRVDTTVV